MYHSIETKGGLYVHVLQNGASRTVHRALRPTMLFGPGGVIGMHGLQQVFLLNMYILKA